MNKDDFISFALEPSRKYPDFKVRFVKGQHIDEVETITLNDMGLPIDTLEYKKDFFVDKQLLSSFYQKTNDTAFYIREASEFYIDALLKTGDKNEAFSRLFSKAKEFDVNKNELIAYLQSEEIYTLSAEEANGILEEFIFIIEKLLPRHIQDLYYFLGLDTRPSYWLFFRLAAKKVGIYGHTDKEKDAAYNYVQKWIAKHISAGVSLKDIYKYTCATKTMIKDTVESMSFNNEQSYEKYKIEKILFGIKDCDYKRGISFDNFKAVTGNTFDAVYDFAVYYKGKFLFLIDYIGVDYILPYRKDFEMIQKNYQSKREYCSAANIPLLRIDVLEFEEEMEETHYISTEIRNAIKYPETIEKHNFEREVEIIYNRIEDAYLFDEYYDYDETGFYGTREDSEKATVCGCYSCGAFFMPDKITKWVYNDCPTCPDCGRHTVIFDSQGFHITKEIMQKLSGYYVKGEQIKLKYIGETFGTLSLTNGKIYIATIENDDYYRVIDDSGEGYLYSRTNPCPADGSSAGGRWEIIED